jgi:lysophospholipase L1-like esterase
MAVAPEPDANPPGAPRILVRSDSQGTSLGEGTVDPHDPRLWAAVLSRTLADRGAPADVRNASSAGLTIAQALAGVRHDPLVRGPHLAADVVILGLGINDWWPLARPRWMADRMDRARPMLLRRAIRRVYKQVRPKLLEVTKGGFRPTPPGQAAADLIALVGELKAAGRRVLLVTPFPVRSPKNPHLDGNTYEACDTVVAVAEETGVPAVDCRTLFQPIEWETISIDHIHVNEAGQQVIAAAVADALLSHDLLQPGASPSASSAGPGLPGFAVDHTDVLWRTAGRGGGPIDPHDELRQVQHDPLVREAYAAASSVVLGLPDRRLSPWERERLPELVDVAGRLTRVVVLAPPSRAASVSDLLRSRPEVAVVTSDSDAAAAAESPSG